MQYVLRPIDTHNRLKQISVKIFVEFKDVESEIRISIEGKDPVKEQALIIIEGLFDIIKPYKNYNHLLHGPYVLQFMLYFGGFFSFGAMIYQGFNNFKLALLYALITLFVYCYFYLFRRFKPYISIDTTKQRELNKFANWLILGILLFIISGSILTFF